MISFRVGALPCSTMLPWLLVLLGCGSVEVPSESVWRLPSPRLEVSSLSDTTVLRVQRLELSGALPDDRLVVAFGPHRLAVRELDRWSGPLCDLVSQAVRTGLTRSRAFAQVKGPEERGREDLVLTGRILEFQEVWSSGRRDGQVALDLKLTRSQDGKMIWQQEISRSVQITAPGAEGAVGALAAALQGVLGDTLQSCREKGVVATPPH